MILWKRLFHNICIDKMKALFPIKKERKIDLTARICQGLREVKLIMDGQLKAKSMDDLLKELEEFN